MGKVTIKPEVQKIIKASVDAAVKKAADAIKAANEQVEAKQRNYFKDTEKLLYNLPALRLSLAEYEDDIKNGSLIVTREKSKDIIRYSAHGGSTQVNVEDIAANKLASIERTRRQIQRIERALELVQDDQYYHIIPLKYWDLLKNEEIAERFNCDVRTIQRNKNRLVNKIKIILFGADALN